MDKVVNQLKAQGFTGDQIKEIEEGLKKGLKVSLYAQKEFLAIQMRQIRIGLEEGLPVQWYANLQYDWFQMEEIRKGLETGLNVSIYAAPQITYDRMHQIRLGLEAGMDLSAYTQLEAGVLKQLRLAVLSRVNIGPYIVDGYDTEQLEAIREALESKLDIERWVRKEYRGVALRQIFRGLEHGCDVSIYAKPEYNWQQMREIRRGLEQRVDVSQYLSVYYSPNQMREIRLGLASGLRVEYYRSPMYTALQMQERRILLKKNPEALVQSEISVSESTDPGVDVESPFSITVSEDEMEAYLEIRYNNGRLTQAEALQALWSRGISYGIQQEAVRAALREEGSKGRYRVAIGQPKKDGKDGWYELFFRTDLSGLPKLLASGKIDYRDVEWFETVEKGQKLAAYHKAEKGVDGTTVTGKKLPARNGREKGHLVGKGFYKTQEDTYFSTLQGIVTLMDNRLTVSEVLVMQDVNLTTGDVNFEGSVLIHGNVSAGATIKAGKDVIVEGYVENATIDCGGTAYLRNGMNGTGGGSVVAGENVIGYFFERADIMAFGTIQGDYFFNSSLKAKGEVLALGKKGAIAGGTTFSEIGVHVGNLGNPAGLPTMVVLGKKGQITEDVNKIMAQIRDTKKEITILGNAQKDFQKKYPPEIRNTMEIYLKIESAIYTKEKELERMTKEKQKLDEMLQKSGYAAVTVDQLLHDGVTIEIDGAKWKAKELKAVVIEKKLNAIAVRSK